MKHGNGMSWSDIKILSESSIKDGVIEVMQTMDDPLSRLARDVSVWRLDTLDAQVRAVLIELGWTPPPEPTP